MFSSRTVRRARRRGGVALAAAMVVSLAAGLGLVAPVPVYAAGETLQVVLGQTDGTPEWTGTGPGLDAGPKNGIVRTNDNITYSVDVNSNGGTASNTKITLKLPQGVQFDTVPALCTGPGTKLTPNPMPAPAGNLNGDSWKSLPQQTLVCDIGTVTSGSTRTFDLVARVRPEVPNDSKLPGITASVTSDAVTTPVVSNKVDDLTVSARAQYDLSKNSTALSPDTGYYYADYRKCTKSDGLCRYITFPMLLSAPAGGKGISPLTGPITFTDDVSPASLFGSAVLSDPEYLAAGANAAKTYGAALIACRALSWQQPGYRIGSTSEGTFTATNAVRNSGDTTCTQPGGAGTPIQVSITGTDTTAYTYPTQAATPAGYALPAGKAYVYSWALSIEIPTKAAIDLGAFSSSTYTLNFKNTYTKLTATDLSGQPNASEPTDNNYKTGNVVVTQRGGSQKFFAGVPNAVGNTSAAEFNPGWAGAEGPAGSTGIESGTGQLFAGGTTLSMLQFSNESTDGTPATFLGCDTWDNSKLQLTNITNAGNSLQWQRIGVNDKPVWVSGFSGASFIAGTFADAQSYGLANVKFQYGTGPGGAGTSTCRDADSPAGWFDDPAAVPGNDQALLREGIYSAVTRVRVNATLPSNAGRSYAWISIGLRAKNGLASGTILPNWATDRIWLGHSATLAESVARPGDWRPSTYDPVENSGNLGDRLWVASAVGRLKKEVRNGSQGPWTTTTVPQYAGGVTVDYRLSPSVTSGISGEATRATVVEDCLPPGENYVSASVTPAIVQVITGAMPAGAGITCNAGETYVKWDLGQRQVNKLIDPITYTVRLSPTIVPGTYTNTALITVQDDLSAAAVRTAKAQVQVVQPKGVWIDKVALTPVVEVNRAGETHPDPLQWRVDFVNIEYTKPVPENVDIVDVLPKQGLNGTSFHGALAFTGAAVTAGSTAAQPVKILYTKAATVAVDPKDASNATGGSTAWCDAPAGGTLVSGTGDCPASAAEVTGLRIKRPGPFNSGEKLSVTVDMLPTSNAAADVYVNQTAGRADGLALIVGPIDAPETVVASRIGDFVWLDTNNNGLQDAGEQGVPNFPVKLTGTDTDGNAVTAETTTGPDGHYEFSGLQSGTYTVTFDPAGLKPNHFFAKRNAGDNDAVDSDGDPTTGVTASITLGANASDLSVDQGIINPLVSIGDTVWVDANANGIQDNVGQPGGELPKPGVVVNLYDAAGTNKLGTTTTNERGFYSFTNLIPGTKYVVEFVAPDASFAFTDPERGDDRARDSNPDKVTGRATITAPATGTNSATEPDDSTIDAGLVQLMRIWVHKQARNCDVNQAVCPLSGGKFALYDRDPSSDAAAGLIPDGIEIDQDHVDGSVFVSRPLAEGTYWLVETKAPQGFQLLSGAVEFSLKWDGVYLNDTSSGMVALLGNTSSNEHGDFTIVITDVPASELPKAGGDGLWPNLIAGLVLLVAGLALKRSSARPLALRRVAR